MKLTKAIIRTLLLFSPLLSVAQGVFPRFTPREVRAAWLTTIGGLDWPQSYARTTDEIVLQKQQLCDKIEALHRIGINTVLFQTRIRGTVVYPSDIEPWDACLSGHPGVAPGYDALDFVITECHRRGMSVQAWIVAFPLMNFKVMRQLGKLALPSKHPELCKKTGDGWIMDPGIPATADYLAEICAEVVSKYDVDGIHLDYIRYPEREIPFNDNATYRKYGRGMNRNDWRRANVTHCVKKIYATVKNIKPWIVLSCSPVGKHDDLPKFSSRGWNARSAVAQDVQLWMKQGVMDEIFPMMYFDGNHFYPFAMDWVEDCGGRIVVPGLGVYLLSPRERDWDLEIIKRELCFLRIIRADGQAFFRTKFLLGNEKGIADYLHNFYYDSPALLPALTWEDTIAPEEPREISIKKEKYAWQVDWKVPHDPTPGDRLRYNVYCSPTYPVPTDGTAHIVAAYLDSTQYHLDMSSPYDRELYYAVTAIDRFGNESAFAAVNKPAVTAKIHAGLQVSNHAVRLPCSDAKFIMLYDATDREISVVPYDTLLDVKHLSQGLYKIYSQGKRGAAHRIGTFLVE